MMLHRHFEEKRAEEAMKAKKPVAKQVPEGNDIPVNRAVRTEKKPATRKK